LKEYSQKPTWGFHAKIGPIFLEENSGYFKFRKLDQRNFFGEFLRKETMFPLAETFNFPNHRWNGKPQLAPTQPLGIKKAQEMAFSPKRHNGSPFAKLFFVTNGNKSNRLK